MRFKNLKLHSLSIVFAALFLFTLLGQSFAGLAEFNADQLDHNAATTDWFGFVFSSHFVVDVAENWQSEYLQFFTLIFATIWFVQKGSPESKAPGEEGLGPKSRWGFKGWVYENSLLIIMGVIFLLSWYLQLISGHVVYNHSQLLHGGEKVTVWQYALVPEFWNRTLQNWQSEFLAVGSMIAFSIYLRQRGSPESKPVDAPHDSNE